MKRFVFWLLFGIVLAVGSGCTTSTVVPVIKYEENSKITAKGNMVVADIEATNYTSYLFGMFPIVGGSHSRPNSSQYHMWQDTISNRKTFIMMHWYGTNVLKGDGLENLKIERETIGWPTLWIVSWRTVRAKAQVVKYPPKKKK